MSTSKINQCSIRYITIKQTIMNKWSILMSRISVHIYIYIYSKSYLIFALSYLLVATSLARDLQNQRIQDIASEVVPLPVAKSRNLCGPTRF